MVVSGEMAVSYARDTPVKTPISQRDECIHVMRARNKNPQPPCALGIGLLEGPTVCVFLMSEVPLYECEAAGGPSRTAEGALGTGVPRASETASP